METVTDFIFLGSKITVNGDCSLEIKRHLLFGRKTMTDLDSVLKSRDILLPTEVYIVKAMVVPAVMWSRAIKRLSAKELMLSNCGARDFWGSLGLQGDQSIHPKGNQCWIFIGRTDAEAEASTLATCAKSRLIEKTLMLGKFGGKRRVRQRMRWLHNITDSMDMNMNKL